MKSLVNFFQVFVGDVGIDLSGGDGSVTQHGLHAADIRSVYQKIGGEAVAQGMGVNLFDNAGFGSVVLDEPLDTARGEAEGVAPRVFFVDETFLGK